MTERKCEKCGVSDADNEGRDFAVTSKGSSGVEVWSWTDRRGVWRVRCRLHLPRAQRRREAP